MKKQPLKPLRFTPEGAFTILHITDTQERFLSSTIIQEFIYDLAKKEKPALAVLTGDNVRGGKHVNWLPKPLALWFMRRSVDSLMRVFDRIYRRFGIPMTMVYGNHDNEIGPCKVSKAEQFAMYAAHRCFVGQYSPEADEGTGAADRQGRHYGTHKLVIQDKTGAKPAFCLWMFDSGSWDNRGGDSCVEGPQIAWFERNHAALGRLPSFVFQHVVVPEACDFTPGGALPAGTRGALCGPLQRNPHNEGLYGALCGAGNVLALFAGHDHGNSYELRLPGPDLVATPAAGYLHRGRGEMRGARVITLDEKNLSDYQTQAITYEAFYPDNRLRRARMRLFRKKGAAATPLDIFTFKPLLRLLGRFGNY